MPPIDPSPTGTIGPEPPRLPTGLPAGATVRRLALEPPERDAAGGTRTSPADDSLDLLTVPVEADAANTAAPTNQVAAVVSGWVAAISTTSSVHAGCIIVPLYGCEVAFAPGRAAILGPAARLEQLTAAVVDFARRDAELRGLERRVVALLAAVERDAAAGCRRLPGGPGVVDRWVDATGDYREAVSIGRRLALLAPAVHTPPLHPPTLASQVGERLRERARLVERHEFAVAQADLAERVSESCSHRANDARVAGQQTALEWAIVVLLLIQSVLLVVDLLARERLP